MKKLAMWFLTLAFVLGCGIVYAEQDEPAPAEPEEKAEAQVPPADPEFVKAMLEDIDKQMTDKRYLNAGRNVNRLLRTKGIDEATQQKCNDLLAQINKIGTDKLTEAEGLVQNDLPGAVVLYNELRNWPNDDVRTKAIQAYAKLNSTPEQQEAWKKAQVESDARRDFKSVDSDLEKKNYVGVMFRLNDLIKRYQDTQTAKDCQAKLEDLKKNNDYVAAVNKAKEKEIGRVLQQIAYSYSRFKQKDNAVNFHKIVIEKFPETDLAKRCEREVARLTEEKAPAENAPQPVEEEINQDEMKKALLQQVGQNLFNIGNAFARYGEKEEAIKFLQLAIEKFPETDVATRADHQIKVLKGEAPAVVPRRHQPVEDEE